MTDDDALTDSLKAHYDAAARKASRGMVVIEDSCATGDCCGPAAQDTTATLGAGLYDKARDRYRSQLVDAGFTDIEIVDSHAVADGFWSVFVRAGKPA